MIIYIETISTQGKRQLSINEKSRKINGKEIILTVSMLQEAMLPRNLIDQIFGSIIDGERTLLDALKEKYEVEEKNTVITEEITEETFPEEIVDLITMQGLKWEKVKTFEYSHEKVIVNISEKS